jgi:hypothetical protein
MGSYRKYKGLADANLLQAARLTSEKDPQIFIARAQVYALFALAELIREAANLPEVD